LCQWLGHPVEQNRARRLICCRLMSHSTIFSDHINLPILKEALRIAQTAILVVVLALRKSTLSLNIDCLYCCNMAWNSSIYTLYIYIYIQTFTSKNIKENNTHMYTTSYEFENIHECMCICSTRNTYVYMYSFTGCP